MDGMSDDLLTTVKGNLNNHHGCRLNTCVEERDGWLRALVASVEQAEAERDAAQVCAADARRDHLSAMKRADALRERLPASMQDCTIVFRECAKGHGWLTATNWVDFPCPTCERDEAVRRQAALELALAALRQRHSQPHLVVDPAKHTDDSCPMCFGRGEIQEGAGIPSSDDGETWRVVPCPFCALRERHAEAVAQLRGMVGAYRVACQIDPNETEDHAGHPLDPDYLEARAWLASKAKQGLEGNHE